MGTCPKCGSSNGAEKGNNHLCSSCTYAKRDEEKLTRLKLKEAKRNQRESNNSGSTKFHGLYCLCIGWLLAALLVCCIVPIFFAGGRKLIKKAFGIW